MSKPFYFYVLNVNLCPFFQSFICVQTDLEQPFQNTKSVQNVKSVQDVKSVQNVKRLNVKRPAHNPIAKPAEQRQPFDKVVVF